MLDDLASGLAQRGWEVTVLTSADSESPATATTTKGIHVVRVRGLAFSAQNHWRRAMSYLSLYPLLFLKLLQLPRHDVVVTKTDPPLHLVLGAVLSRVRKVPAVHWAQDLYPEVAEELEVLRPGSPIARALRRLSTWALRQHAQVVAIGRCMQEKMITARGIAPSALTVIPNWPPLSVRSVDHDDNSFRKLHELEGRFVVMYSGNMGLAHPFETIIDAAEQLRTEAPEVLFLFIGGGPRLEWLTQQAATRGLDNVRFLPFQPRENLAESLAAADLHLVSMQEGTEGLVVPSKVYGVLAAGRPCFFLGPPESEAALLIEENACGEVLSGVTGKVLAERILCWKQDALLRQEAGLRASAAVAGSYAYAVQAFSDLLYRVAKENGVWSV